MGFLTDLRSPPTYRSTYAPWDNFWYQKDPIRADLMSVSPDGALRQLSMVYACVRARSYDMASVSLFLYRLLPRGKERAKDRPLYRLLHLSPNGWQTPFEFEQLAETHLRLRGNFYARIIEDKRTGEILALIPMNPDQMTPALLPSGRMAYVHRKSDGGQETLTQNEVHHRRALSLDGVKGMSDIEASAPTLARAMAVDQYSRDFMAGGAAPPFALSHPLTLGADGQKNLRDSLAKYKAGDKYLILEEAMTATTLGVSARDAQLLEAQDRNDEQIARIFGVPPHRVGITKPGAVSYASSEMADLAYVKYVIAAQAKSNEEAMTRDLLSDTEQDAYVIEYLLDSLLRGDSVARGNFYKALTEVEAITPNEIRGKENFDGPLPGGDDVVQGKSFSGGPAAPGQSAPRTPTGKPRGFDSRSGLIVLEAAARVVQKEIAAATKAAVKHASDPKGWQAWCREFYDDHANFIGHVLKLPTHQARAYAAQQSEALVTQGLPAMADWETRVVPALAGLALGDDHV